MKALFGECASRECRAEFPWSGRNPFGLGVDSMLAIIQLIIALFDNLLVPVVSALLLGTILAFSPLPGWLSAAGWIGLAPLLYFAWLLLYFVLSGWEIRSVFKKYPKARRIEGKKDDLPSLLKLRGIQLCYLRLMQMMSLPLCRSLLMYSSPVQRLALRAYSPSVHIGSGGQVAGVLYDPDLTEIGDDVTLGGFCAISAHGMNINADGSVVYVSAPIKVGHRATVGGESRVAMGVTIGEEAVIEPGSVVAPFTQIGPREIWGGNPAVFRRMRDGASAEAVPTAHALSAVEDASLVDAVRASVAAALNLPVEEVSPEFSSAHCSAWDSLGQLTIAGALYDRLGIRLDPEVIFRLKSIPEIVREIARLAPPGPSSAAASTEMELPDNPELLPLLDHEQATQALARRYQGEPWPNDIRDVTVHVAATFTARTLASPAELWARPFGLRLHVEFFDFNQIEQALLLPSSPFRTGGVNLVLVRTEDLPRSNAAETQARLESYLSAMGSFLGQTQGPSRLVVGTLPPLLEDASTEEQRAIEEHRRRWQTALESMEGVEILDFARIVETIGIEQSRASKLDAIARAGYSPRVFQELGIQLARLIRKRYRPSAKVLALDADHTLWGGVIGEDGLAGIKISSDGPERSFQIFQKWAVSLKERGILLVVVSRNEEPDVWEVFDKHPGMILKRSDLAGWRINWSPKSENIRALAAELNLGVDSFVFVDDDPAVRAEVSARLPSVTVVPMPTDPARYRETVSRLWTFDGMQATAEDRQRTEMIQQERQRKELLGSAGDLAGYLKSLEVVVEMKRAEPSDLPRVAQLTQKTNQFNLSLKRRTIEEVQSLVEVESVYTLRAKDRFGDYGLIGVAMVQDNREPNEPAVLDTLLLSCRALGRGIEEAFLHGLVEHARLRGASELQAPFVVGPRNEPALQFMRSTGLIERPECFVRETSLPFPCPDHLTLHFEPAGRPSTPVA